VAIVKWSLAIIGVVVGSVAAIAVAVSRAPYMIEPHGDVGFDIAWSGYRTSGGGWPDGAA